MTRPPISDPFSPNQPTRPARGECPDCGFNAALDNDGLIKPHFEVHIRTGDNGPEKYTTDIDCDGKGQPPTTN